MVSVFVPGLASRPGGVEIRLAASCYGNRDKPRQHEQALASWLLFLSLRGAGRSLLFWFLAKCQSVH